MILEDTILMKELKKRESRFYDNILNVYGDIKPLLDHRIAQVFPTYTQHDSGHSLRIIEHMSKIVNDITTLNDLEIAVLIYSALLHDIGMAAKEEELNEIEAGSLKYNKISFKALLQKFNQDRTLALQEYIRKVHAERSAVYIKDNLRTKLIIPNMPLVSFGDTLALICEAHTQEIIWLTTNLKKRDVKGIYEINPQFSALVLRLADILDFDSLRTPPIIYNALSLNGYSKDEWLQHFSISNQNKIIEKDSGKKFIEFHGHCSEPVIHRKILGYIDWVNKEIEYAAELSKEFSPIHHLNFYHKVNNFISSENYSIVDMKFQVNYKNIINLLMGEALYGNKELGVRELVQNAIDACEVKKEVCEGTLDFDSYDNYQAKIFIVLDKENNEVIIKDNGIGMNLTIIKNYFLEVGASFYNSDEYLLANYKYNPIGNYGIGFLSSFMLSDKVKVKTKHFNDETLYEVEIFKNDDFVSISKKREPHFTGTEIILNYNQFFKVWENKDKLWEFLNSEFLTDGIQISIVDKNDGMDIIKVNNSFRLESNSNVIDLSPYLNGVTAKIELTHRLSSNIFKDNLADVKFYGEPYFFDGEQLFSIDESDKVFPLSNCLKDNTLGVIDFSIIDYSSDLDEITTVIDREEEIEELYKERYDPIEISLVTLPELLEMPPVGFMKTDEIVEGLAFEDFEQYEHDNRSGTFFDFVNKTFYTVENAKKYIALQNKTITNKGKLYIRGVFVKEIKFTIDNIIQGLDIKGFEINVVNKEIRPNVARNDINDRDKILLRNSIYQALCIHLLENLSDPLEKVILKEFIKSFHEYDNTLVLEEYIRKFLVHN
ncbi:ATP-binding protein [Priestia megaterium]|uniref:HD domain-containing protein n=1 Tax=Priestia megaterium TaxID=1404 RepID=UPI0034582390